MDVMLSVLAILAIVIIYLPVAYFVYQQSRKKTAREKFFKATNAILNRNDDDQHCISQLLLAYKKTVQFHQSKSMPYKNAADFLEELIYHLDTLDVDAFKAAFGFIKTEDMRLRAANILATLKQMQPYASVSSKHAGLLETIHKALDGENTELGKLSLSQLTENIATLENTVQFQSQVNLIAIVASVLGLILGLVLAVTLIIG